MACSWPRVNEVGTPVWPGAGYRVIRLVVSFQVAAIPQHLGRVDGVAVSVLVTPPALLGRDLPEVRAATPEVALDTDRP